MKRTRRARGATCILHGAPRNGQDSHKYNPTQEPLQGAPDPTDPAALRASHLDTAEGALSLTPAVTLSLALDAPPVYMVQGAHALNRAESLAHSLLSRAVFLAEAPAATLATPYELRRAGRQLAIDAAELCHALDGVRAYILASLDAHAAALHELGGELDQMGAALAGALDAAALLDSGAQPESEGAPHAS